MASHERDLFKDKIEVKLDERQVFYLFFGGAVIATLVFVLGVMVGRQVEARAVVEGGTTVTDPLAALDRLEGGDGLAFPSALRGDEVSLGEADATLVQRRLTEKRERGAREVAKTPIAPVKKADASSPAAVIQARRPSTTDSARVSSQVAASKPSPKVRKRFTLQVGSFQEKDEADTFFRTLEGGDYAPYMVRAKVPGRGTYFRVRVGGYASFDEAVKAKSVFENNQHVIAYVTRLK